jgi:hypothetical protein
MQSRGNSRRPWVARVTLPILLVGGLAVAWLAAMPAAPAQTTEQGSGPQQAMPAPLPPGAPADTPGGRTSAGIARPPPGVDPGMTKATPVNPLPGSVIRPPGAQGGQPQVVPK